MLDETAAAIARHLLASDRITVQRVQGGGNNRVYRVQTVGAADRALKLYAPPGTNREDALGRLQREYGGLAFLAPHLPGRVPAAIAVDWDNLAAIYDWVEGSRPALTAPEERRPQDIRAVTAFIADLKHLSLKHLSLRHLSNPAQQAESTFDKTAREACLSAQELLRQVHSRIENLSAITGEPALQQMLAEEMRPIFDLAAERLESWYAAAGLAPDQDLDAGRRILSPSDFGFHNALRRPDGGLTFIDFEYFGWDDPVKLLADVLWHPAMRLSEDERGHFLTTCLTALEPEDPDLPGRLQAQFPLYGLRWAAILLNEFFPERWQRRVFAGAADPSPDAWQAAKQRQLAAARRYLQIADAASKTSGQAPAAALLSIMKLNQ